jgi:peroxin-14
MTAPAPPTPPQLSADKASIDASFARAFTLIEQLTIDTVAIKDAETTRIEKLDTTLGYVNDDIADPEAADTRRENEARVIAK